MCQDANLSRVHASTDKRVDILMVDILHLEAKKEELHYKLMPEIRQKFLMEQRESSTPLVQHLSGRKFLI